MEENKTILEIMEEALMTRQQAEMNSNARKSMKKAETKASNLRRPGKRSSDTEPLPSTKQKLPVEKRSGQVHGTGSRKTRTVLTETPAASPSESFEVVRAKMRESLGASLEIADVAPDGFCESLCEMPFSDDKSCCSDGIFNVFTSDELLHGNGLYWDLETGGEHGLDHLGLPDVKASPQELALRIEQELFSLFGTVNKKYREKGRSLLFNLKDRMNPELREKVILGEISPGRLCSMTADELASKELSQWRIAKAEELAQMVVLPDTDADVKRLVKKTHKGEVEIEGGLSVEVTAIAAPSRHRESPVPDAVVVPIGFDDVGDIGDADFPPIISLDEFMGSLVSEQLPPEDESPRRAADEQPMPPPALPVVAENEEENHTEPRADEAAKDEQGSSSIWDGMLQLNVSSAVTVAGYLRSGETTSAKEWPSCVEIKGRVRLEAFQKFSHELPNSKSRAVTVMDFVLKAGVPDAELLALSEVVQSYVSDDRLGYAEPCPGVEIYFCPAEERFYKLLSAHVAEEYTETLAARDNGRFLIGVVVWRRRHLFSVSPTTTTTTATATTKSSSSSPSSSHHNSKKQRHGHEKKQPGRSRDGGDDFDAPPGFGPGNREREDLPEFSFPPLQNCYQQRPPPPPRSTPQGAVSNMDRMRQLVLKYGATPASDRRRWDDEDDDIPEWQPVPPNQHLPHGAAPLPPPHRPLQRSLPHPPQVATFPPAIFPPLPLFPRPPGSFLWGNSNGF